SAVTAGLVKGLSRPSPSFFSKLPADPKSVTVWRLPEMEEPFRDTVESNTRAVLARVGLKRGHAAPLPHPGTSKRRWVASRPADGVIANLFPAPPCCDDHVGERRSAPSWRMGRARCQSAPIRIRRGSNKGCRTPAKMGGEDGASQAFWL